MISQQNLFTKFFQFLLHGKHRFPTFLLVIFFASLSFGQLEKIQLYSGIAIYIHELVMAIWIMFWILNSPAILKSILTRLQHLSKLLFLFIGWIGVGWLLAALQHHLIIDGILYSARLIYYALFFFSFNWVVQQKKFNPLMIKGGALLSGIYLLYFGLLQYFFIPDTRFILFLGWDDHYFRLISTILDPGFTGILFVLNIFLLLQIFAFPKWVQQLQLFNKKSALVFVSVMTLLFTIGISLTYSRATYLAYGLSAIVAAAILHFFPKYFPQLKSNFMPKLLVISVAILAVSLPFLPRPTGEGVKLERTSTIAARTTIIQSSVAELQGWEWLTGKGLFLSSSNQLVGSNIGDHNRIPDNWLIMLLSGTGLIGTGIFLIIASQYIWQHSRNNPWLVAGLFAVSIHGLFNASVIYVFVLIWLAILAIPTSKMTNELDSN